MTSLQSLDWSLYGNAVRAWLIAILAAAIIFVSLQLVKRTLIRHLPALVARTRNGMDDLAIALLKATRRLFLLVLAIAVATRFLDLTPAAARVVGAIATIALLVQAGLWGSAAITFGLDRYLDRRMAEDPAGATTIRFLGFVCRVTLWVIVALLVLSNALGQDISALVAGLGIGGIAVALAVQNILGDLFASLSIILDKPFVVGDFIIVGQDLGTVEHVGLKTTRLRSLAGEQIVFSNTDLLNSRIHNYKRMFERRVVFSFRVAHGTPVEKLAAIPAIVRELVESHEKTRFDRAHFYRFGDFALEFEVVYYVLDPDYNLYMDIQQAINLELIRRFEALGIAVALPAQTVVLQGTGARAVPAGGGA